MFGVLKTFRSLLSPFCVFRSSRKHRQQDGTVDGLHRTKSRVSVKDPGTVDPPHDTTDPDEQLELAELGHASPKDSLQDKLDALEVEHQRVLSANAQLCEQLAKPPAPVPVPASASDSDHVSKHARDASTIADLERALAQANTKCQQAEALYAARQGDLRAAEVFLDKVDDIADSDVVRTVELLNGQIFQVAAIISDDLALDCSAPAGTAVAEDAHGRLEEGGWCSRGALQGLQGDGDFVLLALQTTLVAFAARLGNSWDLDLRADSGRSERLYKRIRAREPQSVAGRWRALYRRYIDDGRAEDQTSVLLASLSEVVADVLLVCGATGTRENLLTLVNREFDSELSEVVNYALEFRSKAGERIVSRDFRVFAPENGATFERGGMEDDHVQHEDGISSASHDGARSVVCCTQLGLCAERKVESEGGINGEVDIRAVVLVKSKVILTGRGVGEQENAQ